MRTVNYIINIWNFLHSMTFCNFKNLPNWQKTTLSGASQVLEIAKGPARSMLESPPVSGPRRCYPLPQSFQGPSQASQGLLQHKTHPNYPRLFALFCLVLPQETPLKVRAWVPPPQLLPSGPLGPLLSLHGARGHLPPAVSPGPVSITNSGFVSLCLSCVSCGCPWLTISLHLQNVNITRTW